MHCALRLTNLRTRRNRLESGRRDWSRTSLNHVAFLRFTCHVCNVAFSCSLLAGVRWRWLQDCSVAFVVGACFTRVCRCARWALRQCRCSALHVQKNEDLRNIPHLRPGTQIGAHSAVQYEIKIQQTHFANSDGTHRSNNTEKVATQKEKSLFRDAAQATRQ